MKKHIVLSVNDNQDYLFYTPLCVWSWKQFGWDTILMYLGEETELTKLVFDTAKVPARINISQVEGYRNDTVTQISRLYASAVRQNGWLWEDDYLMTGDIDMLALSDYWKPNENAVTVYGHDLTGYGHFPICYIGAKASKWREFIRIDSGDYRGMIKRDLDTLQQAKSEDFYKYWFTDQDLITTRLKEYGQSRIEFINRSQYANGYAFGRVDRGAWTMNHNQFIDCHMLRDIFKKQENFNKTMEMLYKVWPDENFAWVTDYVEKFKTLAT